MPIPLPWRTPGTLPQSLMALWALETLGQQYTLSPKETLTLYNAQSTSLAY